MSLADDVPKQQALSRGPHPPFESSIPSEVAHVVVEWLPDGEYDRAIARIAAEDPAIEYHSNMAVVIDDRLTLENRCVAPG